jgi:hypothetical protein
VTTRAGTAAAPGRSASPTPAVEPDDRPAGRPTSWGARIPAIRDAIQAAIAREGAGLAVLEVLAAQPGEQQLPAQAALAASATKRHMAALADGVRLLEFLETGGSL